MLLVVVLSEARSGGLGHGVSAGLFVGLVFGCVYLHELGHAVAAKYFGIETVDITLLPIGGMARLRSIPTGPIEEFIVAIAGPMVNVLLASMMAVVLLAMGTMSQSVTLVPTQLGLLGQLFAVNLLLVLFNLIPAFPMDGGRVMRAMLSIRMGRLKATELAVRISRYLAFAMIVIGIFYSFSLVLVGIFVLIAGFMEWMEVRRSYAFPGSWPVHDPLSPGSPWESDQRGSGDVIDAESVRNLNR